MSLTKLPPLLRQQVYDLAQHRKDPAKFQCAGCRKYFSRAALQIDHIVPEVESTPEQRLDLDNLQLLCAPKGSTRNTSCHKAKTAQEARARAKANRLKRNWWPSRIWFALAVLMGGVAWKTLVRGDLQAARAWIVECAVGISLCFCTILVYNAFRYRRPRRSISAETEPVEKHGQGDTFDAERIGESFRELVGVRGTVSVSQDATTFTISYPGTGFEDHKDDKRYEAVKKIQSKIGQRVIPTWNTKDDRVTMRPRPNLPKMIHHPGLTDPHRPWHVLPVAPDAAFNLLDTSHLLIVGETNSGKTAMLRAIISAVLDSVRRSAEEQEGSKRVRMILVDPKRIEMLGYRAWGNSRIVTKPHDMWEIAFVIQREMNRRYTMLEERGIPLDSHEKWLCIFDEFKAYFDRMTDVWLSGEKDEEGEPFKRPGEKVPGPIRALADVLAQARKCGIHIVISTQSPDASLFGTSGVRQNMAGRATVGSVDDVRARMIFDDSSIGRDIPTNAKGRATVQIGDGMPFEVQTFWVPDPADADPNYTNTAEDWETLLRLGMPKELVPSGV